MRLTLGGGRRQELEQRVVSDRWAQIQQHTTQREQVKRELQDGLAASRQGLMTARYRQADALRKQKQVSPPTTRP